MSNCKVSDPSRPGTVEWDPKPIKGFVSEYVVPCVEKIVGLCATVIGVAITTVYPPAPKPVVDWSTDSCSKRVSTCATSALEKCTDSCFKDSGSFGSRVIIYAKSWFV